MIFSVRNSANLKKFSLTVSLWRNCDGRDSSTIFIVKRVVVSRGDHDLAERCGVEKSCSKYVLQSWV